MNEKNNEFKMAAVRIHTKTHIPTMPTIPTHTRIHIQTIVQAGRSSGRQHKTYKKATC